MSSFGNRLGTRKGVKGLEDGERGVGVVPDGKKKTLGQIEKTEREKVDEEEEQEQEDVMEYARVVETFVNRHTKTMYQRQIALLKKVAARNFRSGGYYVADLEALESILEVAHEQMMQVQLDDFIDPIVQLIRLNSKPFIRKKSNEELSLPTAIPCMVKRLAKFLRSYEPEFQVAAAEMLTKWATGIEFLDECDGKLESSKKKDVSQSSFAHQTLSHCGVIDAAVYVMNSLIEDEKNISSSPKETQTKTSSTSSRMTLLLFPVLRLVHELSFWPSNALIINEKNGLDSIVQIVESVQDVNDELLPICLDILSNCLEYSIQSVAQKATCHSRKKLLQKYRLGNAVFLLGTEHTLVIFKDLISLFLLHGYRKQDKLLRNEAIAIVSYLSTRDSNHENFRFSGLLDILLGCATAAEMGESIGANARNYSLDSAEDFEFKVIIWDLLATLVRHNPENAKHVADSSLLQVLLMYVMESTTKSKIIHQWTDVELHQLQLHALAALLVLAPLCPDTFHSVHGPSCLLELIESSAKDDLCSAAMPILLQSCYQANVKHELGAMGAIEILLRILNDPKRPSGIRCDAASIIGALCHDRHVENQERFRREGGIALLIDQLTFDPSDVVRKSNTMVAVVHAISKAIVGDRKSETTFAQLEGVERLLDLLEACPPMMQNQVLAVLADICLNPKSAPYFESWRSSHSRLTSLQLLLKMWRNEELRLGIVRKLSSRRPLRNPSQDTNPSKAFTTTYSMDIEAPLGKRNMAKTSTPVQHAPIYPQGFSTTTTTTTTNNLCCTSPSASAGAGASVNPSPSPSPSPSPFHLVLSPAFTRLKDALLAGQDMATPTPLHQVLEDEVSRYDQRSKIYSVFSTVALSVFTNNQDVEPQDQLTLVLAREYTSLLKGQHWEATRQSLHDENIIPIDADGLLIESHIDHSFNVALAVKETQMRIEMLQQEKDQRSEEGYFQSLMTQKEQDAEIERLMRRKRKPLKIDPKTRHEAKVIKDKMLQSSLVREDEEEET